MNNTSQQIVNSLETWSDQTGYTIPDKLSLYNKNTTSFDDQESPNKTLVNPEENVQNFAVASRYLIPLKGNFQLLQLWEGRVTKVLGNDFEAILVDKTDTSLSDELIVLSCDEISQDDLPLLVPGAVFFWSIGYADYPGRGRSRESRIRFRRLRGWTSSEIIKASETGQRLAELFKFD